MKIKFLPLILGTVFALMAMTSCLNSNQEDIEYSNQSAITAFSLGKLKVKVATSHGDSIYYIDGLKYPFSIDQQTLTIQNPDSLPYGTDLSKVMVNVKGSTATIVYKPVNNDETQRNDTLWVSTDSLNFAPTKALQFKVLAQSGILSLPYTVRLNVHQQNPELMVWKAMKLPFDSRFSPRAIYYTEQPYSRLDLLGVIGQETLLNSVWIENGEWKLSDTGEKIDERNIDFLTIMKGGYIIPDKTTAEENIQMWMCPFYLDSTLYVVSNGKFATGGLNDKSSVEDKVQPQIASTRFTTVVVPVSYNANIRRMIIAQQNPEGTSANVYQRLTNDDAWIKYEQPAAAYCCPNFESIKIAYYDGKLIAFGGKTENLEAFSAVYESYDYGLTWKKSAHLALPAEDFRQHYASSNGVYSIFTDENNYLWVVWADGTVYRGRINRLGTNTTK